ncbi:MAG: phytanoyl-CoA dioxygenase family protein [Bacteroidales bacterium]|nr:phytanoyl-CoA dioxygenase family protein [Bacteroidales bacterium]
MDYRDRILNILQGYFPYKQIIENCEVVEWNEAVALPLKPGSCVLHHGATVHYGRGNTTNNQRRAMIVNLKPQKMINYEREH